MPDKLTKDQVYQEYREAIAKIDKEADEAREKAKATLRRQLKTLRDTAHKELKALGDLRTLFANLNFQVGENKGINKRLINEIRDRE